MEKVKVLPVSSRKDKEIFLTFPWRIYRNDPLWVPPLLPERRKAIDPRRGAFFRHGEAEFFIAWRGQEPLGTICCAVDFAANEFRASHPACLIPESGKGNAARAWKDCVIGFFECLDDPVCAQALFAQAESWAKQRGLDALYGPFNLDYEDSYGILIEGRDRPPAVLCGHTPPYYQDFYEACGFRPARGDNLAYAIDLDPASPQIQRLFRLAENIRQKGRFRVRQADLKRWREEADRVYQLINRALAHLPDFLPWGRETVQATLEPFRKIADPELVLFAETAAGETVGWLPGIPNLNEAFIHANGLRAPWNALQLLWYLRRRTACLAVKSVLVLPEYWRSGVAVLLFAEMARRAAEKGYRWVDLSLTSADNPNTPILAEHMGARIYKRYRVYRKWLDQPHH